MALASTPRWRFWLAALAVLAGPGFAAAQEPVWRLPRRGAAEYRRSWDAFASDVARTAAAARALPAEGKVPERYLHRLPPAPWVCQGELDAAQQVLTTPCADLRDLLRAVACDLAAKGSSRWTFPRLLPLGDVVLTGAWSKPDATGQQQLRAAVVVKGLAALPLDTPGTLDRLRPFAYGDAAGELRLQRTWDPARGLVSAFRGELDVVVAEGKGQWRRLLLRDGYELLAVREHQDFDFRKRVAAAIQGGTSWVKKAIAQRKSFLQPRDGEDRDYSPGRLALGLLTLVHGQVPRDDPVLQQGFAELYGREIEDTYSLATALMAVAARFAPTGENERIRAGELAVLPPRQLGAADRAAVAGWLAKLLQNIDPRSPPDRVLRWNYTAGPRYDTSLQQYGLLGLWSAHVCGVPVPAGAFAAAGRHFLAVQGPARGAVPLRLYRYADLRGLDRGEGEPTIGELRVAPRGFAYREAVEPAYGSMTSAGISGMLLARAGMLAQGRPDRALDQQFEAAIRDAFGWLAAHFSVRANPGFAERADHHWYYWMYGLERSCELAGVAWLDGRDWYHEGALQLLSHQVANGSWKTEHPSSLTIDATCFAVLFLAKATAAAAVTRR